MRKWAISTMRKKKLHQLTMAIKHDWRLRLVFGVEGLVTCVNIGYDPLSLWGYDNFAGKRVMMVVVT